MCIGEWWNDEYKGDKDEQEMQNVDVENDQICFLLDYCSKYPELYNKIANILYDDFGICGAELTLLITYICKEMVVHEWI